MRWLRVTSAVCGALCLGAVLSESGHAHPLLREGCFERTYSAEHLRRNPAQTVRQLSVRLSASEGLVSFGVRARLVGRPQAWKGGGPCRSNEGTLTCQPDTDGDPAIRIEHGGASIRFVNPVRLKLVDDVTGPDLNEVVLTPPGDRLFVLRRTSPSVCAGD
jgi:hypothetical protein